MRTANGWSMATDFPLDLHAAMFVRDALALDPAGDQAPGPLLGPLPDLRAVLPMGRRDHHQASQSWAAWWTRLVQAHLRMAEEPGLGFGPVFEVYDPPLFRSLAADQALQSAAGLAEGPFRTWWHGPGPEWGGMSGRLIERLHTGEMLEHEAVQAVQRRRGRAVRSFHVAIDVLAVEGTGAWPVAERYALVAVGLRDDRAAYRAWLEPIVERLA